jgi:hypothetical protein
VHVSDDSRKCNTSNALCLPMGRCRRGCQYLWHWWSLLRQLTLSSIIVRCKLSSYVNNNIKTGTVCSLSADEEEMDWRGHGQKMGGMHRQSSTVPLVSLAEDGDAAAAGQPGLQSTRQRSSIAWEESTRRRCGTDPGGRSFAARRRWTRTATETSRLIAEAYPVRPGMHASQSSFSCC